MSIPTQMKLANIELDCYTNLLYIYYNSCVRMKESSLIDFQVFRPHCAHNGESSRLVFFMLGVRHTIVDGLDWG